MYGATEYAEHFNRISRISTHAPYVRGDAFDKAI